MYQLACASHSQHIYLYSCTSLFLPTYLPYLPTAMSVVPNAEAVNAFLSMKPQDLVKLALQQFADFQRLGQDSRQHVSYTHFFHLTY